VSIIAFVEGKVAGLQEQKVVVGNILWDRLEKGSAEP